MAVRLKITILLLSSLLISSKLTTSSLSKPQLQYDDEEEDLSFLEESDDPAQQHPDPSELDEFDDEIENYDDFEVPGFDDEEEEENNSFSGGGAKEIDEKDVVILKEANFSEVLRSNRFVMVEFYAPWCGHCQALAPEYAAAAAELKGEEVVLAKVDATEENELAEKYDVQGFPTVYFFVDGVHKPYPGPRTRDAIVTWIKKKIGPGVHNITTTDDAEKILASDDKVVLAFLDSLVGPESEELAAASRLEDDVNFYQTVNPNVAELFHIDPKVKFPALVLLKKEAEKVSHFDGQFSKSSIVEFVLANKLPLVTTFTRESASLIFESPIKKQLLLFAMSKDSSKVIPIFQEAAKLFRGKLIFVFVELDNEDVGKPVSEFFGISGDVPKVIGYLGTDDAKRFALNGIVTLDKLKAFGKDFVEDKLKPSYKSDPLPESNDGDVKIVVGDNFDEIVLDKSKDVLLEIYAPWCGHCQALEPTFNKLARHLRGIDSLTIAKMDGTTNEHPRAKAEGFPTLLFFPAGNKSFDPIPVDVDRTVVSFYKFIKKHAFIPFKLQKPTLTPTSDGSSAKESTKTSTGDLKDEL